MTNGASSSKKTRPVPAARSAGDEAALPAAGAVSPAGGSATETPRAARDARTAGDGAVPPPDGPASDEPRAARNARTAGDGAVPPPEGPASDEPRAARHAGTAGDDAVPSPGRSSSSTDDFASLHLPLDRRGSRLLLLAVLVVALCGIVYELIIGAIASYLLGDSVLQFSLTVGAFMFAMGVGSLLSRYLGPDHLRQFVWIEIAIALLGGLSGIVLFTVFPFARPLFELAMYGLILSIGTLVGLEIPVLTSLFARGRSVRESLSGVLTLDYVGALLGSMLFPLVLLPALGPIRTAFAVGLANIAVALATVVAFRGPLGRQYRPMLVACLATALVLCAALVLGARLTAFAEKHLYFDAVLHSERTPYQHLVVTRSSRTGDTRLFIDGHIQFSSRDEYRYHEYLVHPAMSVEGSRARVLVLGGGDGLAAREILKYADVERVDLVDIDPAMTRIHAELPMLRSLNGDSLRAERVRVVHEDAFSFVNRAGPLYDRVIADFPDPHDDALGKLYSREFYTMIRRRLRPGGVMVTQSSSPFFTRRVFWSIARTLDAVFESVTSYHTALPSFGIWGFNLARKGAPLPTSYPVEVPTRALEDGSMIAATRFDADLGPPRDNPVNSIMRPRLSRLYREDMRR